MFRCHQRVVQRHQECNMGNFPCCVAAGANELTPEQQRQESTFTFRYHKNTCALEYYEPVQSLAEGSISSIHLVRRRPQRVDIPYQERADILEHANSTTTSITDAATEEKADDEAENEQSAEQLYVLKSIIKDHVHDDRFLDEMRSEIYTMKFLDHPGIAKVYEGFERKRHVYLVMEYCSGGDLRARFPYSEHEAAVVVKQILSAVTYLHSKNVVHRDLKLENVVFADDSPNAAVKLIDFGLATKYLSDEYKMMRERVGTLYSMAPQVIQGVYDKACDLWSVGVITYMLLSGGEPPFDGDTRRQMIDSIMRCQYSYSEESGAWKTVSRGAKNFIDSLLKMDPKERLTARRALHHPWLRKLHPARNRPSAIPGENNQSDQQQKASLAQSCNQMHSYSQETKLKRLAMLLLAHQASHSELAELREVFGQYDQAGDGRISYTEFKKALTSSSTRLDLRSIHRLFHDLDMQKDGYINYSEFIAATLEARGRIATQRIREAFDRLDIDQTGSITKSNLKEVLSQGGIHSASESFVDEVFDELDTQTPGTVTYDEFAKLFAEKHKQEALEALCCENACDNAKELIGEDAIIPGGKYKLEPVDNVKQCACPKYVYDKKTKSMHRNDDLSS